MTDKPVSIVDIHIKKVNDHCAELCRVQLADLNGTLFEDFIPHLRSSWLSIFENFEMSADELTPLVQATVRGNVIVFYSAMVVLQFTDRPVPQAIDDINTILLPCVEWHSIKGDGFCVEKHLDIGTSTDNVSALAAKLTAISKDVFHGYDYNNAPLQLLSLVCQISLYHLAKGNVYSTSEYGVPLDDHDNPVTKVTFTNGLKTSVIFIDIPRAIEDWDDFISRATDNCTED
jgi:hypothetical protein